MITRENLQEVINSIAPKDRKRILNTYKEYCVIYLSISNACHWVNVTLTNDYTRYKNASNNGDCILCTDEVIDLINRG